MKPSVLSRLQNLNERYEEITYLLGDNAIISDQLRFRELSKEYAQLQPLITCFQTHQKLQAEWISQQSLLDDEDKELRELVQKEMQDIQAECQRLEQELSILLLPRDPLDERNIYLEIRAGTGGDEAALFVGDLFRMYARFAEEKKWQLSIISESESEKGGFKEIVAKIEGQGVYGYLKFESGAHRVQRIPVTESQGRIHTSACTVAVLPVVEAIDHIDINPDDLRIDTYRSSGAGGQHVNKTDSAIRITHIPTNTVVECQDERSQHKNRAKALDLLQARLLSAEQAKQRQHEADTRRVLVGSGDRSERIRTYNFPQARVTDHRINLTLYKLMDILAGHLSSIIDPLRYEFQIEQLASLGLMDENNS